MGDTLTFFFRIWENDGWKFRIGCLLLLNWYEHVAGESKGFEPFCDEGVRYAVH